MNNKEKISLLKKFIDNPGGSGKNISLLPRELETAVVLKANMLNVVKVIGAFSYMQELEREEREKEIAQIQKQQTKILDEQKIFTKILALATLLLGVTAFFNFFGIKYSIEEAIKNVGFLYYIFFGLGIMGVTTLVITFGLLIKESIKLFVKN